MTRRHAPEEYESGPGPLFDSLTSARHGVQGDPATEPTSRMNQRAGVPLDSTWPQRETAMESAASRAERLEPSWKDEALEQVRRFALCTPAFICEEVGIRLPDGADRRALGAVMHAALREGYVQRDGFRHAHDGSPKTQWKSLIYVAGASLAQS